MAAEMQLEDGSWVPASSLVNTYVEPEPEPGQAQLEWLSNDSATRQAAIRSHFNQQYDLIRQHSPYMGIKAANEMITQAHLSAQQEYSQVQDQANNNMSAFRRIQALAKQGAIATTGKMNPEKLMWQMVGGEELAEAMFPTEQRTDDQHTRFTESTRQRDILEKDLEGYQVVDEGKWNPFKTNTQALQKYDPISGEYKTVSRKDMSGNVLMGEQERGQFRAIQQALADLQGIRRNSFPGVTPQQRAAAKRIANNQSRIGSTIASTISAHVALKQPTITKADLKKQYKEIYQTQGPEAAVEFANTNPSLLE
ncbi:hypothetical protein LCGC14_0343190 [marine sediment metagenome]|uniref:Uncharacterized protein n=1 Tax=marine sediment metagenome TaxID=412755 RepID=A0A0F9W0E9_9ZZZZ